MGAGAVGCRGAGEGGGAVGARDGVDDAAWFGCAGARDGGDAGWVDGRRRGGWGGAGRNGLVSIREEESVDTFG